jgi:hypothetical protein
MNTSTSWIYYGLEAEAAKEITWLVIIVFVAVGIAIWRSEK